MNSKIDEEIILGLIGLGRSRPEAEVILRKCKSQGRFEGKAEMEVSDDGKYFALNPCECDGISPSGKAMFFFFAGKKYSLPRSQLSDLTELHARGDRGCLVMTRWIAEQNQWVDKYGKILLDPH